MSVHFSFFSDRPQCWRLRDELRPHIGRFLAGLPLAAVRTATLSDDHGQWLGECAKMSMCNVEHLTVLAGAPGPKWMFICKLLGSKSARRRRLRALRTLRIVGLDLAGMEANQFIGLFRKSSHPWGAKVIFERCRNIVADEILWLRCFVHVDWDRYGEIKESRIHRLR